MKQLPHDLLPFLLMSGIVVATLIIFWKLLDVVVLSVSLAVVLSPLHAYCSRSLSRYFSALLVTALVAAILLSAAILSISILSSNQDILTDNVNAIHGWVNASSGSSVFGLPLDRTQVAAWFDKAESFVINYWNTILADPFLIAFKVFLFFLSFSIFLLHGRTIYDRIMEQVPVSLRGRVLTMSAVTVDTLYAIFIVHAGISALTFVIALPFFYFLGYGHVLFYSFVCALCELIPVLGSSVLFIFLGIYALATGDISRLLFIFFFGYIGVSALPEIYIRPVFMGRRVKLHPLIMLVGFFGGVITLGMAGFVLGPVFIVLLFTGYHLLIGEKRRQDNGSKGSGHRFEG